MNKFILLIILIFFFFTGCSEQNQMSEKTIPACLESYTQKGDANAINDLMEEFGATMGIVQKNKNRILLSEAISLVKSRNLRGIEGWVCRAQKLYERSNK